MHVNWCDQEFYKFMASAKLFVSLHANPDHHKLSSLMMNIFLKILLAQTA